MAQYECRADCCRVIGTLLHCYRVAPTCARDMYAHQELQLNCIHSPFLHTLTFSLILTYKITLSEGHVWFKGKRNPGTADLRLNVQYLHIASLCRMKAGQPAAFRMDQKNQSESVVQRSLWKIVYLLIRMFPEERNPNHFIYRKLVVHPAILTSILAAYHLT
jgi:hypothetical protein